MPIQIDTEELRRILSITPADQNIMLVGRHGIGKSEIIRAYYQSRGMPVVAFFLGQMSDPGDLIGLLHKNLETGRSEFLPPSWWPADGTPVVLFLDELNRARPEILQSIMELTLSKSLAGRSLPAGSVVVSAVNDGDEYQLTDLDPALVSRFNVYEFRPTIDDWFRWAADQNVDPRLIEFLRDQPHWIDGQPTIASENRFELGIEKTPDRRAWARVGRMMVDWTGELQPLHYTCMAGIVGSPAAAALRTYFQSRLPIGVDAMIAGDEDDLKQLQDLTLEQTARLNHQYIARLKNDPAVRSHDSLLRYLQRLDSIGRRESVAHFISLSQQADQRDVAEWMTQSIAMTALISQYLESMAPGET